jgi:hypothetical protein
MKHLIAASVLLLLIGCDPTAAEPGEEPTPHVCRGDGLVDDVGVSDDLEALAARWDENKELVRVLFIGEPL